MIRPHSLFLVMALAACSRPVGNSSEATASFESTMVRLGPATFEMGTDSAEISDLMNSFGVSRAELFSAEVPRHRQHLPMFEIDRYEVTNDQYREFVEDRPEWSTAQMSPADHNGSYLAHWQDGLPNAADSRRPVTHVTWHAAAAYCAWVGKRLPTEPEWEYAARGGLDEAVYPWGTTEPDSLLANWSGSRIGHPVEVGSYRPNPYGLFDMAGNVWEYVADRWAPYGAKGSAVQLEEPGATRRVIRGGSWGAAAVNLRVRYRDSHPEDGAGAHVGLRCARSIREAAATAYGS